MCPMVGMWSAFLITRMYVWVEIGSSNAIATSTISTFSITGNVAEKGVTVACLPVVLMTVVPEPATGILACESNSVAWPWVLRFHESIDAPPIWAMITELTCTCIASSLPSCSKQGLRGFQADFFLSLESSRFKMPCNLRAAT